MGSTTENSEPTETGEAGLRSGLSRSQYPLCLSLLRFLGATKTLTLPGTRLQSGEHYKQARHRPSLTPGMHKTEGSRK
jgi:hypothetical protein